MVTEVNGLWTSGSYLNKFKQLLMELQTLYQVQPAECCVFLVLCGIKISLSHTENWTVYVFM